MFKYCVVILIAVFISSVLSLFQVKFNVQNLSKDMAILQKQLKQERDSMYVLQAEWTYLNQPARLKALSDKYLKLQAIQLSQLHKIENNLPLYLAEDSDVKELYLASLELSKYHNEIHSKYKPYQQAVPKQSNKGGHTTVVKY